MSNATTTVVVETITITEALVDGLSLKAKFVFLTMVGEEVSSEDLGQLHDNKQITDQDLEIFIDAMGGYAKEEEVTTYTMGGYVFDCEAGSPLAGTEVCPTTVEQLKLIVAAQAEEIFQLKLAAGNYRRPSKVRGESAEAKLLSYTGVWDELDAKSKEVVKVIQANTGMSVTEDGMSRVVAFTDVCWGYNHKFCLNLMRHLYRNIKQMGPRFANVAYDKESKTLTITTR